MREKMKIPLGFPGSESCVGSRAAVMRNCTARYMQLSPGIGGSTASKSTMRVPNAELGRLKIATITSVRGSFKSQTRICASYYHIIQRYR